jgi:hypothetical protein
MDQRQAILFRNLFHIIISLHPVGSYMAVVVHLNGKYWDHLVDIPISKSMSLQLILYLCTKIFIPTGLKKFQQWLSWINCEMIFHYPHAHQTRNSVSSKNHRPGEKGKYL